MIWSRACVYLLALGAAKKMRPITAERKAAGIFQSVFIQTVVYDDERTGIVIQ